MALRVCLRLRPARLSEILDEAHCVRPGDVLGTLLVVAGGGRHNTTLMQGLRRRCQGVAVRDSDSLDIPAEAREALVFALLAWWHHHRHPGNAPEVTGASRAAVLGVTAHPG